MKSSKVVSATEFDAQPIIKLKAFARRHLAPRIINVAFTFIRRHARQEAGKLREIFLDCRRSLQIRDLFEKNALGEPDLRRQC